MKKSRSATNAVAVKKVAAEMGLSERFVRQCIRKERDSATADTTRKKYKKVLAEIDAVKA